MIQSKSDLKHYIKLDKIARFGNSGGGGITSYLKQRKLWKFNLHLRRAEYHFNNKGPFHRVKYLYHKFFLRRLSLQLGWWVPVNTCGAGLCIVHPGTVVINEKARIGEHARIHVCVNIGAAPVIGDHVYIGPGAKIFGRITIGNHIKIGANAVVNKSFPEDRITLAGVPARIVKRSTQEFSAVEYPEE